jgi:hypothetical protein
MSRRSGRPVPMSAPSLVLTMAVLALALVGSGCEAGRPNATASVWGLSDGVQAYLQIQPEDTTCLGMEQYVLRRHEFLRAGGGADRRWGAGAGARLRQYLKDAATSERDRRYLQALDEFEQFSAVPAYRLEPLIGRADAAQAFRILELVTRANRAVAAGAQADPRAAIDADPDADTTTRRLAREVLAQQLANPGREQFKAAHPAFAEFFPTC